MSTHGYATVLDRSPLAKNALNSPTRHYPQPKQKLVEENNKVNHTHTHKWFTVSTLLCFFYVLIGIGMVFSLFLSELFNLLLTALMHWIRLRKFVYSLLSMQGSPLETYYIFSEAVLKVKRRNKTESLNETLFSNIVG